jgi:hypothetical protein
VGGPLHAKTRGLDSGNNVDRANIGDGSLQTTVR